jgi:hypothetical protein
MGDALIHFEYGLSGVKDPSAITVLAKASEVGSLWGIAYDKFRNRVFSSAVLRRHSGLGPLGLGGIYVTDMNTNTTTDYVDVAAAPLNINVGAVPSNVARNLGTTFITPSNDADAFALVGKVGIGDIDISEDGNFLFFTNLHDRRLYQLDISGASPTLVGSYPIPGACEGGTSRPFGLKVYQGKVYVGVVCDALASDNKSNLRASVQEFTPGANTFTEVFNFPLTYPKGPVFLSTAAANAPLLEITGWFPWTDDFDDLNPNSFSTNTNSFRILHPQPILSDIEFDVDGSMVLGFADRTGMQTGYQQYPPVGTELFSSFSGGDILRAAKAGNVFLLENNGTVNGITGAGPDNNQGPGFGEFYNDDWLSTNDRLNHSEQAFGALALLPGSGQVVMTSMDPLNRTAGGTVNTGGIKYLSNSTGQAPSGAAAGFILYDSNTEAGTVAKSTGLGDLELGCSQPTYLQIGNYVWLDTDQDGVQDACEDVLPGVLVSLYDKTTNTFLASTTTSASGEYYFTGLGAPNENWVATAGYDSLQANTQYTIVFGYNGADMNSQFSTTTGRLTLGGMPFVPTVANTGEGSNADLNDSDATTMAVAGQPYTNYPMIMLTTGGEGSVNHTYDAGFAPSLPVSLGDTTWVDANRNGLQDPLEVLLADVTVRVFNAADDTPVTVGNDGLPYTNSTTTNAMGFYEFTNLPPGDYYVVFDLSTVPGSGFLAFTSSNAGDDADDSDADPLTGRSSNTGFLAAGTRFPDLDAGIICNVSVEAGTGQTICSTANVDLTALGASIMPTGVAGFAGTWTSSGTGTFSDGAGRFGVATFYTPSAADILVGQVILTLTTDNPMDFGSLLCDPASDDVMIVILKVNCGSFPWSGN